MTDFVRSGPRPHHIGAVRTLDIQPVMAEPRSSEGFGAARPTSRLVAPANRLQPSMPGALVRPIAAGETRPGARRCVALAKSRGSRFIVWSLEGGRWPETPFRLMASSSNVVEFSREMVGYPIVGLSNPRRRAARIPTSGVIIFDVLTAKGAQATLVLDGASTATWYVFDDISPTAKILSDVWMQPGTVFTPTSRSARSTDDCYCFRHKRVSSDDLAELGPRDTP